MEQWLKLDLEDFQSLFKQESEFQEGPVDLETFLYDPHYMGRSVKKLSDVQLELIKHMTQIYLPHTLKALHGEQEGQRIWDTYTEREIVAMCGKGGGKDFCSRLAFCRVAYLLHCLKNPLEYYGKAHGTYIDLLNIAVNADQAQRVFFEPLKNLLKNSPYFVEKGFEPRRVELMFHSSPIRLFSGNSEAESWEGLDLLLVVHDEIAAFKMTKSSEGSTRLSAESIYNMSMASVSSRFPSVGKVINISFPRGVYDFIMTRYRESEFQDNVYRLKATTWDMNPTITRESLEPEFKRDPVMARARYACEPPTTDEAYFRDPELVRRCFKGEHYVSDASGRAEYRVREDRDLWPIDEFGRLKSWFKCNDDYTRYIHVDLALKHDRAALAMVHVPGTRKIEVRSDEFESLPVVKMDLVHWWQAAPGQEIDFGDIREFVKLLCRKFPVGQVTLDQWQSNDFIKNLQSRGINAEMHGVKKNDYDTLKTAFYDGRFSGYYIELLVEHELLQLQLLDNGKIDHLKTTSKDLADALAGATFNAIENVHEDAELDIDILGGDGWEDDLDEMRDFEAKLERDEEKGRKNAELYDKKYRRFQESADKHDDLEFNLQAI